MSIAEVFPRPTVKQVIFQIRFPNLFFIESKIGDIQIEIMDEFPDSALQLQRSFIVADLGPGVKMEDIRQELTPEPTAKIWHFRSPKGYELNILSDSLDITSQYHKSYDRPDAESRFRDVIQKAVGSFLKATRIPMISRVGLRYVNECPVPAWNSAEFENWYATTFPFRRFPLEDAQEMMFRTEVRRGDLSLRYGEQARRDEEGGHRYELDLDAFATQVRSEDYLTVTDQLHTLVVAEFGASAKQPLIDYMRKSKED